MSSFAQVSEGGPKFLSSVKKVLKTTIWSIIFPGCTKFGDTYGSFLEKRDFFVSPLLAMEFLNEMFPLLAFQ